MTIDLYTEKGVPLLGVTPPATTRFCDGAHVTLGESVYEVVKTWGDDEYLRVWLLKIDEAPRR